MSILSIQSHVAYGYVGNRAAVFPLQRLGHEVCAINTVQFSNHTGYGKWQGQIFSASHVNELVQGLAELKVLADCQAIISGYLGNAEIGQEVLNTVALCREHTPELIYACDPVMGDVGRGIFVKTDIPDFIRNQALAAATLITPNHFEMELLVQRPIDSLDAAKLACNQLMRSAPRLEIIVITSFKRTAIADNVLEIFLATPAGYYLITTPLLAFTIAPNGTGDLFSALFLGHYLKTTNAVAALEATVSAVFSILAYTYEVKQREMQIIAAQACLVNPSHHFVCTKLE